MEEVTIIGVDLAKNVFQVCGAAADGSMLLRKKLSRPLFAWFMAEQRRAAWRWRTAPACTNGRGECYATGTRSG